MNNLFTKFTQRLTSDVKPAAKQMASPNNIHTYDVTPFAEEIDLTHLDVIKWAPVWMTRAERLLLYTLIFTLRPLRYLEIGTFLGGSALVVAAAMDALDHPGKLVCIDPFPKIASEHWSRIEHRTTLLTGYSPQILPQAQQAAEGPFDFVLIDGDHTYKGVLRDAKGVLPFVTDNAYLLIHDSFYPDVARGLHKFAHDYAEQIIDFGILTREVTYEERPNGDKLCWGGLRLMQVRRNSSQSGE